MLVWRASTGTICSVGKHKQRTAPRASVSREEDCPFGEHGRNVGKHGLLLGNLETTTT